MRRRLGLYGLLPALLLLSSAAVQAAGRTGVISREIDVWPSAVAMGQAAAASSDPLVAVWVNPAGLHGGSGQIGATHTEWVLDTRAEQLAAALGGPGRWHIGLSALVITTSDIPLRPPSAGIGSPITSPLDFFEARDFTVGVTGAYDLTPQLTAGATIRSLTQKVYVSDATTMAADFGLQFRYSPRLRLGAVLANVGPDLDWGTDPTVPLPRSLRAGGSFDLSDEITVAGDVWTLRDRDLRVTAGLEWHPVPVLAVRSGYLVGNDSQSFSAGLGLNYRGIGLDYAVVPLANDLGTTHRVALRVIPSQLR